MADLEDEGYIHQPHTSAVAFLLIWVTGIMLTSL